MNTTTMRALEVRAYGENPELILVERPVPRPGRGQVLVRIAASPINPSDMMFLRGLYGLKKKLPIVPGFEASGIIVAVGSGATAGMLLGRHVACAAPDDGDGTWAEYMVTAAQLCVPLRKSVSLEQGAMMIVNPLTAWALIEIAKKGGHKAVAQTAAAGALGRMILRLARRRGLPVVHVVRRQEQVALLRSLGAEHVLDSSDPEFDGQLKELCHRLQVSLAFDAVAGAMTGRLLQALVPRGRVLVYGGLSLQACQLHPGALIFEGKRVEGFWLTDWLRHKNILSRMRMATQVQKLLASDLRSDIRARLPLEHAGQGIQQYAAQMTGGKILITPDRSLS